MKRILASLGVVAAIVGGMVTPTFADGPTHQMTAEIVKVTSGSAQTTSAVSVNGTWATDQLEVGQEFTVNATNFLKWSAEFPFLLDSGEKIGDCTIKNTALTCKVTTIPASAVGKSNISGRWWANARIQDSAVGKNTDSITLNGKVTNYTFGDADGDGVCDSDCNGVHYENAGVENIKAGWRNVDGTVSWMIKWATEPGVEYTIHDENTRLSTSVKCAKGDTWSPSTTEYVTAIQIDDNTITMRAPEGSRVCVTFTPEPMKPADGAKSVTNVATINGTRYESTVEIKVAGGTDGDGTVHPLNPPEPTPSETTPAPKPTPSETTPAPKPTPSETTPAPKPTPSETTPAPKPTPSETTVRLPVTGAAGSVTASAAIALLALGGFALWARRRAARSE